MSRKCYNLLHAKVIGGTDCGKIFDHHRETECCAGVRAVLGVSGRNDGYIENDGYVITWCVGHLVEMVYPEEVMSGIKNGGWKTCRFCRGITKYNVIPSVSRQYDVVHKMLHRE